MGNIVSGEMLLCFDELGNVISSHPRAEVHRQPVSIWHAVTHIWVVNSGLEILCSKRANFVEANPGKWQTFFGGHVLAGESFEQNAIRELGEEVGIVVGQKGLIYLSDGKNEPNKHLSRYYVVVFNGGITDLKFNDKETAEARWLSYKNYLDEYGKNPGAWCNTLSEEKFELIKKKLHA